MAIVEASRLRPLPKPRPALRTARVLFVIFLALLIPVRGAVAGAMLCPTGGTAAHHATAEDDMADMHRAHAHHGQSETPAPHATHDTGCNLCATFCSMTPMPSTAPTIEPSMLSATLSFPALHAPAPSFQSGGPDRPPRSR